MIGWERSPTGQHRCIVCWSFKRKRVKMCVVQLKKPETLEKLEMKWKRLKNHVIIAKSIHFVVAHFFREKKQKTSQVWKAGNPGTWCPKMPGLLFALTELQHHTPQHSKKLGTKFAVQFDDFCWHPFSLWLLRDRNHYIHFWASYEHDICLLLELSTCTNSSEMFPKHRKVHLDWSYLKILKQLRQ